MPLRLLDRALRRPGHLQGRELKVYFDLIDHLYSDVGSVAGGVVGLMVLAGVSHAFDRDNFFLEMMALLALVGFSRLALIRRYRSRWLGKPKSYRTARLWEISYGLGAISFAFIVGVFGVLVAADPKTDALEALVLASVVGYAGGIAGRNAGRPCIAIGQVVAACLPPFVYMVAAGGGVNYGVAAMLLIYMATLIKIVSGLRLITKHAFEMQRDVGEANERLEAAVAHMRSGLCMLGPDGSILVLNQRARDLLRLPGRRFDALHEMLLAALASGGLRHDDIAALQEGAVARREVQRQVRAPSGVVLTLRTAATPTGGMVLTIDDITELTRANEDIERMATSDELTGLANRATVMRALAARMDAPGRASALLLIDLDRFKEINDTLGHDVGDELLRRVGDRLRACAPSGATIGRLGGDEFVVVAPDLGADQAMALAARINDVLSKPMRLKGQSCATTASIGVAAAPDHGADPADLMKAADIALYDRKAAGRNGANLYDDGMGRRLSRRRRLEQDLAATLKRGGLALAFQPIVDAADPSRILVCEALARWEHPELGRIAPDEFIPIAESSGLIRELGRQCLHAACAAAKDWPDHVKVAVNISAAHLADRDQLFDDIWSALTASGLPARRLELEITESMLVEDSAAAEVLIDQLRKMDVSVSLDDFGTGYSSLAYLRRFRFDKIKLDRAFAAALETDPSMEATVSALADIARANGGTLLLEGVETERQARLAARNGVAQLQGFHFSRPLDGAAILLIFGVKTPNSQAA